MTAERSAGRNRALLAWYAEHRRDLPWRDHPDPWWILVSEVMAQQTQVARVVPVFERFVERFPTPASLARASTDRLITAWEGLGYLRRAFALRDAARRITEDGWPCDPDGLERLPGVGPYTAAAVACFAFGVPVPAVDVNLRRVVSRWQGSPLDVREACEVAAGMIDADRAADWNQAVMDLSAAACRPAIPRCDECPVEGFCADPSIRISGRRQSRFAGSVREARASILKAVAEGGPRRADSLASELGLDAGTVSRAVAALTRERVLVEGDGVLLLSDQG